MEVYMGFLKSLKSFFVGTSYRINRKILKDYIEEVIAFARKEHLSFCDEFYLMTSEHDTEKLHIFIINYDVKDGDCLDAEKDMSGIVIFVNEKKAYDPEHDEKYYSSKNFVDFKLLNFPDEFILINDLGEPISLEPYKIQKQKK